MSAVRLARALAAAFVGVLLASRLVACSPEHVGEEHAPIPNGDARPAVSYAELRRTPSGSGTSGFEQDVSRLREESATDIFAFEDAPDNVDLTRRAALRTFEGAPPAIPHAVQQGSAPECLSCHDQRLALRGRTARPICHDEHTNCTQCHVTAEAPMPGGADLAPDPRAVANRFVGMRSQRQPAEASATPPRIPHIPAMREKCTACHGKNGPGAGHHPVDFLPERALPAEFALSDEGHLTCTTCHKLGAQVAPFGAEALGATATTMPQGSDLCLACHEASHEPVFARLELSGGAHPGGEQLDEELSARMERDATRSGCLGCHGTDGTLNQGVLRDAGEGRVCAVCHAEKASADRSHPVEGPAQPRNHVPAEMPTGEEGAPICRSCHDLVNGESPGLVRVMGDGSSMCMSCHDDRQKAMNGAHGKAGEGRAEPCEGCHQVHGADRSRHLLVTTQPRAGDPSGCLSCHGRGGEAASTDARPGAAGHPVNGRKRPGVREEPLTCGSCHDAHDPDPSLVVCAQCHPEKSAAFDRGGHGDAACLDCHPAHASEPRAAIAGADPVAARCLGCHDPKLGKPGIKHVSDYTHPAPVFTPGGDRWEPLGALPLYGPDGRAVEAGENGDLTCSTCHVTHGPDPSGPADHLRRSGWQGVCSACHGDDSLLFYRYFHERDQLEARP